MVLNADQVLYQNLIFQNTYYWLNCWVGLIYIDVQVRVVQKS